jgi:hypothetical protein
MTTQTTTKASFESWSNGGLQMSGFHCGTDAADFEQRHYESNTFATLHTFDSVEEGRAAFERLQEECN